MSVLHFLNVNDGDCSIISTILAGSRSSTSAKRPSAKRASAVAGFGVIEQSATKVAERSKKAGVSGNFNQSEFPDNPIDYMKDRGLTSVFRFVSTHPDMDHLDGIKAFFEEFRPANFWDTGNTGARRRVRTLQPGRLGILRRAAGRKAGVRPAAAPLSLPARGGVSTTGARRVRAGATAFTCWRRGVSTGRRTRRSWNDSSYVILYRTSGGKRILFAGDSHDSTWEHLLANWGGSVAGIDVLIAPHHGRDSGRVTDSSTSCGLESLCSGTHSPNISRTSNGTPANCFSSPTIKRAPSFWRPRPTVSGVTSQAVRPSFRRDAWL